MNEQFPQSDNLIYLNHAAVAPWPRCTYEAVERFARENMTRGASAYPAWVAVERRLRERLARLVNAGAAADIALLKNTSEALSVIAYGLDWQPGDNVVFAGQEFPSNRIVWESLAQFGVEPRVVEFRPGNDPEAALIGATDARTRLLSTSSVHYASGLRMDLERLGGHCRARDILFCVDAIQSLGAFPLDARAVRADFVVADGHKWMLGPEGLAVFYCRPERLEQLKLNQYGWHMVEHAGDFDRTGWRPAPDARRFECGSPNMLGVHALEASLALIEQTGPETIAGQITDNVDYLLEKLDEAGNVEVLSPREPGRRAGILTFRRADRDPARLHRFLADNGVICAHRGGGVRFSPHFYNTPAQLDRAISVLKETPEQPD